MRGDEDKKTAQATMSGWSTCLEHALMVRTCSDRVVHHVKQRRSRKWCCCAWVLYQGLWPYDAFVSLSCWRRNLSAAVRLCAVVPILQPAHHNTRQLDTVPASVLLACCRYAPRTATSWRNRAISGPAHFGDRGNIFKVTGCLALVQSVLLADVGVYVSRNSFPIHLVCRPPSSFPPSPPPPQIQNTTPIFQTEICSRIFTGVNNLGSSPLPAHYVNDYRIWVALT